ncbi:MAG: hypothetical protein HQM15_10530 [Deltaproteobacteria bacterium]|nr:hypothetical protein [Deltaproteobacteria bacterium]
MEQCESIEDCFEVATVDAYGEYEQASSWLTCIEEMFGKFDRVQVLEQEVGLEGFDLANETIVVALCRQGNKKTKIPLESVHFQKLSPKESLWMDAWKNKTKKTLL